MKIKNLLLSAIVIGLASASVSARTRNPAGPAVINKGASLDAIRSQSGVNENISGPGQEIRNIVEDVLKTTPPGRERGQQISKRAQAAVREWKNPLMLDKFDVSIGFFNSVGTTVAHENGLTFHYNGMVWTQPVYYIEAYWGEYPLYLAGANVDITVSVTNKNSNPAEIDVEYSAYTLNTDGTSGALILSPTSRTVTLDAGETRNINVIFQLPAQAKNLNRFLVNVNSQGQVVMTKEGIFCPPEELP